MMNSDTEIRCFCMSQAVRFALHRKTVFMMSNIGTAPENADVMEYADKFYEFMTRQPGAK